MQRRPLLPCICTTVQSGDRQTVLCSYQCQNRAPSILLCIETSNCKLWDHSSKHWNLNLLLSQNAIKCVHFLNLQHVTLECNLHLTAGETAPFTCYWRTPIPSSYPWSKLQSDNYNFSFIFSYSWPCGFTHMCKFPYTYAAARTLSFAKFLECITASFCSIPKSRSNHITATQQPQQHYNEMWRWLRH